MAALLGVVTTKIVDAGAIPAGARLSVPLLIRAVRTLQLLKLARNPRLSDTRDGPPRRIAPGGPVPAGVILPLLLRQLLIEDATAKSPDE